MTATETFASASAEELRVIIALMENDGKFESEEALSKISGVSRARCLSAIALWSAEGILDVADDSDEPTIIEEFEERIRRGEFEEIGAKRIAKTIRDNNLAEVINECSTLLGIPTLPTEDIKTITRIYTEYSLTADYILMLAAHLSSKNKFTVMNLKLTAEKLISDGINTPTELEQYIKSKENNDYRFAEYRRLLGLYGRNLSKSEKETFAKWMDEYIYSLPIIEEAYDIMAQSIGKYNLAYMDAILTDWHNADCKTVEECKSRAEAKKTEGGYTAKASRKSKTESPKPRYGDFDVEDAFKRALARSYGDEE